LVSEIINIKCLIFQRKCLFLKNKAFEDKKLQLEYFTWVKWLGVVGKTVKMGKKRESSLWMGD